MDAELIFWVLLLTGTVVITFIVIFDKTSRKIDSNRFNIFYGGTGFLNNIKGYSSKHYDGRNISNNKRRYLMIENDFGMCIKMETYVKVYIDDILVIDEDPWNYKFWKHNTPKEMKKYIREELKILKKYKKDYDEMRENESNMTFKAEQKYLVDKFNK